MIVDGYPTMNCKCKECAELDAERKFYADEGEYLIYHSSEIARASRDDPEHLINTRIH